MCIWHAVWDIYAHLLILCAFNCSKRLFTEKQKIVHFQIKKKKKKENNFIPKTVLDYPVFGYL